MELIEILKGAKKRIESAEYLADGYYEEMRLDHGQCFCAVGHIFKEMEFTQKDFDMVDGYTVDSINFKLDVKGKLLPLLPIEWELQQLQDVNDGSFTCDRKENVLRKLNEIITKLESEQNGNPSN